MFFFLKLYHVNCIKKRKDFEGYSFEVILISDLFSQSSLYIKVNVRKITIMINFSCILVIHCKII